MCKSQYQEAADSNSVRLDDVSQITSVFSTSLSKTINMVFSETQDTFHYTENDLIIASMRPSRSDTHNTVLSPSCISYDSFSGTHVDVNSQSPAVHEGSHTDSLLSQDRDHSSIVHSSQVSDNTFTATHYISDDTAANLSTSNYLLDLGLICKGFRIGHINIQGVSNKIDQVRLLLESDKNLIHVLGLSESKLNVIHPDAFFEVNGFQKPFRRDRKANSGVVF